MASIIVAQNYQFGERGGAGSEPLVMKTINSGNAVTFALAHPQSTVVLPDYTNNPNASESKTGVIMTFDADKKVVFYHNTVIDMRKAQAVQYKPSSIITDAIQDYNVTEVKMADNSISTRAIIDASVANSKLATDSVSTDKIIDGAVTTNKIANNAVTAVKLASNAVTSAKISDGAVVQGKLGSGAVIDSNMAKDSVTTNAIKDKNVTSAKLAKDIEFQNPPTLSSAIVSDTNLESVNGTFNDNTKRMITNATWVKNYVYSDASDLARKSKNETVTGSWTFTQDINGIAVKAKWADLAESYQADDDYPVGTLVCFGGEKEITVATSHANAVISEQPAVHMNAEMEGGLPIALSGRVRVRVVGKVEKFDKIILSDLSGVGVADNCSCGTCVVGRALENKETEEEGLVLCVVSLNLD